MNLVNVLKEIKTQANSLKNEYDKKQEELKKDYESKIKDLQTAYEVNLKMNTVCLDCDGTGKQTLYAGTYECRPYKEKCKTCNGTGKIKNQ